MLACAALCLPISIEEANHALGLLEGLNQPIEKNPVKTAVAKFDAIFMVFAEGVHRLLLGGQYQELIAMNASATSDGITGYQGRSPWLVSSAPSTLRRSSLVQLAHDPFQAPSNPRVAP